MPSFAKVSSKDFRRPLFAETPPAAITCLH
jgi:hypothetical protein